MATSYTSLLRLAQPAQGELSGTWGTVVNDNITAMVEEAVAGLATIDTWAADSATLSTNNGTTDESRVAILELTDTTVDLTGAGTLICPTSTKQYIVNNATNQQITIKTSGGTGVAIADGQTTLVYCDGTNVVGVVTTASTTQAGVVELADVTETNTGTDDTRAVTPDGLDGWTGSAQVTTVGTIASGTWSGDVIVEAKLENQSGTNTGDEVAAAEGTAGVAAIATSGEVTTGTNDTKMVTPLKLEGWNGGTSITTVGTIAAGTWSGDVIVEAKLENQSGTNTGDEDPASETVAGVSELATQAEVDGNTGGDRVVTSDVLNNFSGVAASTLAALTDTVITTVGNGEVLVWDSGTDWINRTFAEAGIAPVASPTFTGTVTIPTADINGGNIDGTVIGVSTAANGTFATCTATTFSGLPAATISLAGVVELATGTETNTGTATDLAVTPDALDDWTGSPQITTVGTIAAGTWSGDVIAEAKLENQSGTNTGDEPDATDSVKGIIELADQTETDAGSSTTLAVSPSTLANYSGLGGGTIAALTDTIITTPANGEVLVWSGGADWINNTFAEAGIAPTASPTFTGTVTGPSGQWDTSGMNIATDDAYQIAGTSVLNSTTLGSAIVTSSLTTVGTIGSGTWQGTDIDAQYLDSTLITTSGVTYTNLNNNGDVGTGSTQVSQGNHTHSTYLLAGSADTKTSGTLKFNDNIICAFGSSDDMEIFCDGAHGYIDLNSGIGNFYIRDGTSTIFTFNDNGNFTATGNVTAYSDERLKKNIEKIDDALFKVKTLSGYTFDRTDVTMRQTGVIAQEVVEVLPEVVVTDESGHMAVNYGAMMGLIIEAIKDLDEKLEDIKNGIAG